MADEADMAHEVEQQALAHALANVGTAHRTPLPYRRCGFCRDTLPDHLAHGFCDQDCRKDWEREQDAKRRNGG